MHLPPYAMHKTCRLRVKSVHTEMKSPNACNYLPDHWSFNFCVCFLSFFFFLLKISLTVMRIASFVRVWCSKFSSILMRIFFSSFERRPDFRVRLTLTLCCQTWPLTFDLGVFHSSLSQVKVLSWGADVTWIPPSLTLPPSWPHCRPPSPWVMRRGTTASTTSPWPVLRSISALSWLFSVTKGQTAQLTM